MRKLIVTESEREQIKGLYEQPVQNQPVTDESLLGISPSKIGFKEGQIMKNSSGAEIGKLYVGMGPNAGHRITITYGQNGAKVFNPEDKSTRTISLEELRNEYKQRMLSYTQNMLKKINTPIANTKYMSDDDVAKLNTSLKTKQ